MDAKSILSSKMLVALAAVALAGCSVLDPGNIQSTMVAGTAESILAETAEAGLLATEVAGTLAALEGGGGEPTAGPASPTPTGRENTATPTQSNGEGPTPTALPTGTPTQEPTITPTPTETIVPPRPTVDQPGVDRTVDFNGDGYSDLAVGAVQRSIEGNKFIGGFMIFDGGLGGFRAGAIESWLPEEFMPDIKGFDLLGEVMAAGDFDGNGYTDLALGRRSFKDPSSGAVSILYSGPDGLSGLEVHTITEGYHWINGQQVSSGLQGVIDQDGSLGTTLAVGDFNGDGYDDLAAGAPTENIQGIKSAGEVAIIYGSPDGLVSAGNQRLSQNYLSQQQNGNSIYQGDILAGAEEDDLFGNALAAGDLNGDGFEDLVVGNPQEDVGSNFGAGNVNIIYGSAAGLTTRNNQVIDQGGFYTDFDGDGRTDQEASEGAMGGPENYDSFGHSLAIGNFNGDAYDDLAIGTYSEDIDFEDVEKEYAGVVQVFFGGGGGISLQGEQLWNQKYGATREGRLPGEIEGGNPGYQDYFGRNLAAGDFNADSFEDLAIGTPNDDISNQNDGSVTILYGGPQGLQAEGSQLIYQVDNLVFASDTGSLLDPADQGDGLGGNLTVGDYNGDGITDLVIVSSSDHNADDERVGAVYILFGRFGTGLVNPEYQRWDPKAGTANGTDPLGSPPPFPSTEITMYFGQGVR